MSYVDPPGKTPLYRLALTTLQTEVFDKFHSDDLPAGWFYKYPVISSYFQLPDMSAREYLLDDLCDAGRVTRRHTKKFSKLCGNLRGATTDYKSARSYITTKNLEEEFKIWADVVEELWHGVDFTKTFHDKLLHGLGLCFPTLLNSNFPTDLPDPLHARLFAAREWDQLSELDEDEISEILQEWVVQFNGRVPPERWVRECYQYYWAVAKAQYVRDLQELEDIMLNIIRVYLSHYVNHLNNQTELSNQEVPHAGIIPAPDPDPNPDPTPDPDPANPPRVKRHLLRILKENVAELEQVLEDNARVLLGRQAEAVRSTFVPSLPEHLPQVRGGFFL
jgi:hypothetical protein